ncbi:hypothetical protein KC726_03710 [Candidatus Woesebacteria bacterium]|nr:hypothetical protein [Candidatus Woesebacteria bacterium]
MQQTNDCPHCPGGFGLRAVLEETERLWIVADVHPLVQGHILVILREHVSCIGAMNQSDLESYKNIYDTVKQFIKKYTVRAQFLNTVLSDKLFFMPTYIFYPFLAAFLTL